MTIKRNIKTAHPKKVRAWYNPRMAFT